MAALVRQFSRLAISQRCGFQAFCAGALRGDYHSQTSLKLSPLPSGYFARVLRPRTSCYHSSTAGHRWLLTQSLHSHASGLAAQGITPCLSSRFLLDLVSATSLGQQPVRTRTRYSLTNGGPRTVQAVVHRFFRLNNGMWIRPRTGRKKRRWRKPLRRVNRLKYHIFCNGTQSRMLDRMVNKYYRTPKYWVNDAYEQYHKKTNVPDYEYVKRPFYP